jgi:hypothetical protein
VRYKPRDGNLALGFRATDQLRARVRAHAAARKLSVSECIRVALEHELSRDEPHRRGPFLPSGPYDTPTAAVQHAQQATARTLSEQMAPRFTDQLSDSLGLFLPRRLGKPAREAAAVRHPGTGLLRDR